MRITDKKPAKRFGEAFPLGNGHLGAMVYGGIYAEQIDLSHNTFFSGERSENHNQKGASEAFYRMRGQAEKEYYEEVHQTAEAFIGVRHNYGTNLPVGKLFLDYDIKEEPGEYERTLDIYAGKVSCVRSDSHNMTRQEVFTSNPDRVLVCKIINTHPIGLKVRFEPGNPYGRAEYHSQGVSFFCYAYEKLHCDEEKGVKLAGYVKAVSDGEVCAEKGAFCIKAATRIELYLTMLTDYQTEAAKSTEIDLLKSAELHANVCVAKGLNKLEEEHGTDMLKLWNNVWLELEGNDEVTQKLPFLFQYGRYLLYSSSRADSKLPAHLQGIWNDNVACRIGWTCDMHLDINTQMNYWLSETTDLGEANLPLFQWIQKTLANAGAITARESYGLDGWVAEIVSNPWGYTAPYWAIPIAPCPTGGVWILTHMWEHYLYTEDLSFLRDFAFPLITSAVRFFHCYVFEDKQSGMLTSGPSISPENGFLYKERQWWISNGCTYEILMIRELFQIYLEAVRIFKISAENQIPGIQEQLERLLPYRILEDGTLAEWSHNLPGFDKQHRHTSHLLGLYPFAQITPEETPELCKAVERSMDQKLTPLENWEDTGWARTMLMLYEARLYHGEQAYGHIKSMVSKLLEPNQMVYHPPTRGADAFDHVYELDGNTGLTAGIVEMLMQSHKGVIRLLPAIPNTWEKGKVCGLRARGNIEVSIKWENGHLLEASLLSKRDKTIAVSWRGIVKMIALRADSLYVITESFFEFV